MNLNRRHKAGLLFVVIAVGASLLLEASAKQAAGVVLLGLAATWIFGNVSVRTLVATSSGIASLMGFYLASYPIWSEREAISASAIEYDAAVSAIREAVATAMSFEIVPPEDADTFMASRKPLSRGARGAPDWADALLKKYGAVPAPTPQDGRGGAQQFTNVRPITPPAQQQYSDLPPGAIVVPIPKRGTTPIPQGAYREIAFPEISRKWIRGNTEDANYQWNIVAEGYPADMSAEQIMQKIQADTLVPRPKFSIRASASPHRLAVIGGLALALVGLSGAIGTIWHARKARGTPAPIPA